MDGAQVGWCFLVVTCVIFFYYGILVDVLYGAKNKEANLQFYNVTHEQPHFLRGRQILAKYPQIRDLYGPDPNQAYLVLFAVLIQLLLCYLLPNYFECQWYTVLIISYVFGAFMNSIASLAMHEASHNLFFVSITHNRWLAIFANCIGVVPTAMTFFRWHSTHHLMMGIKGRDNDLASEWEIRVFGKSRMGKLLWLLYYPVFGVVARKYFDGLPNRWEIKNLFVVLLVDFLVIYWCGWMSFLYLFLSEWWCLSLHPLAGHWIHEHYNFGTETNSTQETYSYYGILNYFSLNVGYHNEHHDFPQVPGSKLPLLKKIAGKEYYDKLQCHNSWAYVMFYFVMNGNMGHHSRISRDKLHFSNIKQRAN